MKQDIVVAFHRDQPYQFHVNVSDVAALSDDEARRWLDEQWDALECEPVRPTGKVLLFDKLLSVARAAGEPRFAENGAWAHAFARSVARLLERPLVVVDVGENRIG